MNTKQFNRILLLVLLLTLSAMTFPGTCSTPEKRNYLESVIAHSTGFEQVFFKAIQNQGGCDLLLQTLGIIQTEQKQEFGSVKFPGKNKEPLYADKGETIAINFRKKLAWQRSFGRAPNIRQIMLFTQESDRANNQTLVLTRDNLNLVMYTDVQMAQFDGARLLRNGADAWLLELTGKNRGGIASTKTFKVSAQGVVEIISKSP